METNPTCHILFSPFMSHVFVMGPKFSRYHSGCQDHVSLAFSWLQHALCSAASALPGRWLPCQLDPMKETPRLQTSRPHPVPFPCSSRSRHNPIFFIPNTRQRQTSAIAISPFHIRIECESQQWEALGSRSFTRPSRTTSASPLRSLTPKLSRGPAMSQNPKNQARTARLSQSTVIQSMP